MCISGSKITDLREEKALAGFDPIGHSGIHIQSMVVNAVRSSLAHFVPQLTDIKMKIDDSDF